MPAIGQVSDMTHQATITTTTTASLVVGRLLVYCSAKWQYNTNYLELCPPIELQHQRKEKITPKYTVKIVWLDALL